MTMRLQHLQQKRVQTAAQMQELRNMSMPQMLQMEQNIAHTVQSRQSICMTASQQTTRTRTRSYRRIQRCMRKMANMMKLQWTPQKESVAVRERRSGAASTAARLRAATLAKVLQPQRRGRARAAAAAALPPAARGRSQQECASCSA